ncbi:MAG: hypothetical protein ACKOTH_02190, partial [Solirubrobacterales bacterium]
MSEEPAIETVASVGVLDHAVVTLREFLHHSTAARAIAVVEREPGLGPAVIDCGRFEAIEVELGDRTVRLPHDAPLDAVAPPLPEVKPIPPFEVGQELRQHVDVVEDAGDEDHRQDDDVGVGRRGLEFGDHLLRRHGRGLLPRDPQLRGRAGLHQHRLPDDDLHLQRLLGRRRAAAVPGRHRRG